MQCTYISDGSRASLLQPEVSFDKLCATRKSTMSELTKNCWQKRRRHKAHDVDISGAFCGRELKDIRTMMLNTCIENSTRGVKYSPAR